jgi:hypothetical protein
MMFLARWKWREVRPGAVDTEVVWDEGAAWDEVADRSDMLAEPPDE